MTPEESNCYSACTANVFWKDVLELTHANNFELAFAKMSVKLEQLLSWYETGAISYPELRRFTDYLYINVQYQFLCNN